jgi:hypothetical protein
VKRHRSSQGQSLVEYAVGLGCITALCMVALGSLGYIDGKILHGMEHAFNGFGHGEGGATSPHGSPMVDVAATPWQIN